MQHWVSRWQTVLLCSPLLGAAVIVILWRLPASELRQMIGYGAAVLSAVVAVLLIHRALRRLRRGTEALSWRLLSLGLLGLAAWHLLKLLYLLGLDARLASPAWPFLVFVLAHGLLWAGVITQPGRWPRLVAGGLALVVDAVLTLAATGITGIHLGLHLPLQLPQPSAMAHVMLWGYALVPLLGLLAQLWVLGQVSSTQMAGARALLALGLGLLLAGDGGLAYLCLGGKAQLFPVLAMLWAMAPLVLAAAAQREFAPVPAAVRAASAPDALVTPATLVPALPVAAAIFFAFQAVAGEAETLRLALRSLAWLALLLLARVLAALLAHWQGHRHMQKELAESQRLALTDVLTNLPNKRAGLARLAEEHARAQRYARPYAVIFTDIDFFKLINDTHGHHVGDQAICAVGQCLRDQVRTADMVARFGGEEFVLILPETTQEQATRLAERLRKAVENLALVVPNGSTQRMTISLGVAAYPESSDTPEEVIIHADDAMNQAKDTGRNRVVPAPARQHLYLVDMIA